MLALAGWLRSLPDERLAALIDAREVRESSVKDWFDLAEALLSADSIKKALARLDRTTLSALRSRDPSALGQAYELGLAFGDAEVPDAVAAVVPELDDSSQPAALVPVPTSDRRFTDRVAAEHAYRTTGAVVELVIALHREPAKALARGGITLPDSKRLAAAMGLPLDDVPAIVDIAERAGLVVKQGQHWLPTEAAAEWPSLDWAQRWARLAAAWSERLPDDIRIVLAERAGAEWGDRLTEAVDWMFPLGGAWMRDRIAVYTRDAALLGITADHVPSSAGNALLTSGPRDAGRIMAAAFPPTVDTVYLQHDLSVVAPGALRPDLDARLRELADRDGPSTYRISAASVNRALALGRTERDLQTFLQQVSRTGIPQPLAYLLRDAASRYGTVRVRARGAGSEVRSSDDLQLRAILADSGLTGLGLVRDGDALRSGHDREVVFWALAEARYPVAAEDAQGRIERIRRHEAPVAPAPQTVSTLVERLRLSVADTADDERAWLARQLDLAIRGKVVLTVTVAMPGGQLQDYQLEPSSLAGGRLRARDRAADIERTLPLSSIQAISPAQ